MKGQTDSKKCAALRKSCGVCCRQRLSIGSKRKTIMKNPSPQLILVSTLSCSALLWYFTGCSSAPQAPPKEVTIQADDKMRYDVTAFDASPGQKISVTFKNVGTTPKFSMGHNFVLLDRLLNA